MYIICSDLEGVFVPEIWINVADKTGIGELRLTTRDIPDYDELMGIRLDILKKHSLKLKDIQDVIAKIDPLPGAVDFLDWMRKEADVIVVSDTFTQFADPLMEKLGRPVLFCNSLEVDDMDNITGYKLRQQDGKRHVAKAIKSLNFKVIAMGDSYNDVTMLKEADHGIFFRPPEKVIEEYPDFPVALSYDTIKKYIISIMMTP